MRSVSAWFHGCLPGMSDKIINWDLDRFPLQDVLKCLEHQIIVKRICRNQEKFNYGDENSDFIPVFLARSVEWDTWGPATHVW